MLVKRYLVDDMPEALSKIRQDLGKDAIILSSKRVRAAGFTGLLGRKKMEVIAALNEVSKPAGQDVHDLRRPSVLAAQEVSSAAAPVTSAGQQAYKQTPKPASAFAIGSEPLTQTHQHERKIASGSPVNVKPVELPPELVSLNVDLIKEMREIKSMLSRMTVKNAGDMWEMLATRLKNQDIDEKIAEQLIARITTSQQQLPATTLELLDLALAALREDLEAELAPRGIAPTSKLVSFVGPTGVGKTTTIAKIAADHVLRQGRSVALLTTDTYRIAAVEQLRTYANLLNVPLQVIYGEDDLREALAKFSDYDLILMDSAGRNYGNRHFVDEVKGFLEKACPDETYLVLSLTARTSVLRKIVDNFSSLKVDRLLFTKLDETDTVGAIYSLAMEYKLGLSYVTIGQNVPDDIQILAPEEIAKLIVGEKLNV
ncbi:MAG: flhF [Bacilli bacterium]|nr:flhF [Bacilli bacterium]